MLKNIILLQLNSTYSCNCFTVPVFIMYAHFISFYLFILSCSLHRIPDCLQRIRTYRLCTHSLCPDNQLNAQRSGSLPYIEQLYEKRLSLLILSSGLSSKRNKCHLPLLIIKIMFIVIKIQVGSKNCMF